MNPPKVPPKVRIAVLDEAQPVMDFLAAHRLDIGSLNADRLDPRAPPDMRLLCVALVDDDALRELILTMQRELSDSALGLTNRVALLPLPLDTLLLVFLDIVAIESPLS